MGGEDGAEEGDAVVCNGAEVRDEGAQAGGAAVAGEVEGEAGEAGAG